MVTTYEPHTTVSSRCGTYAYVSNTVRNRTNSCTAPYVTPRSLPAPSSARSGDESDGVTVARVTCGCVLADAGYGISAGFRQALSARGLTWAVGITRTQKVYPAAVTILKSAPTPEVGRPRRHPRLSILSAPAEQVLAARRWRRLTRRSGAKGPLAALFSAVRIVVADRPPNDGQHLPGEPA